MSYSANPRAQGDGQYVSENPGHITKDSLAAESLSNNGNFAANQSGVYASSQPSGSTTANTYDTSGATTLPATDDNTSRLPDSQTRGNYQTPADSNSAERSGTAYHSQNLPGGSTGNYDSPSGGYGGSSSDSKYGAESAGTAPSYTANRGLTREQATAKGGAGEGGFSGNEPNASFNTDIGSRNDPGRYAEAGIQRSNAQSSGDAGYPNASNADAGRDQGGFENLGRDTSA